MCRELFWATTVAVVCCVGGTNASPVALDGTDRPVFSIPEDVARFLSDRADTPSPFAVLSQVPDMKLPKFASVKPTFTAPHVIMQEQHPTAAELPLVPLPAPVATGGVGLLVLGFVGLCQKIRKQLRYPVRYPR